MMKCIKKNNNVKIDNRGEYVTTAAHNSQSEVIVRENLRYEWNGHHKQWWVSREKMQELHNDNRLQYNKSGVPRIKRYLEEMSGIPLRDVWKDISSIQKPEKTKYATQKPLKLLDRIIKLYSNNDDLVLDIFAGSGTTGIAAKSLGRNYILVDRNQEGKDIFEQRLNNMLDTDDT